MVALRSAGLAVYWTIITYNSVKLTFSENSMTPSPSGGRDLGMVDVWAVSSG